MTQTEYDDARASASVQLLSAQMYLAPHPDAEPVVRALNDLRAELQPPRLRLVAEAGGS